MADRRMFTKKITETDSFLDMPMSTQALYFHLCMNADDDGFVKNPKRMCRMLGCADDDLRLLIVRRFVLIYEPNGILIIKHWRMHNYLRKDRYHPSEYAEIKDFLYVKDNGAYTFDSEKGEPFSTVGIPDGNQWLPEVRLGKDSIGKNNKDNIKLKNKHMANDLFEKLWKLYPKKKGKGKVSDTQKLKLLKIGYDKMAKAIEKFKDDVKDKDEQYVMYGSTFFNSGYVDYISDDEDAEDEIDVTKYGVTKEWFENLSEKDREDFLNERR